MTDPTPPNPLESASEPEPGGQPNHIARSVMSVVRRTERALSPWSRRLLQTEAASTGVLQRNPAEPAPASRAPRSPVVAARNPAVTSGAALTLAHRVQRAETPTVIQRSPEPRTALSLDRFAATVVRRFPEMAAKYEPKTAETPETVQRSSLPFVGSESSAPDSSMSAGPMPAGDMPSDEAEAPFYPTISAQESIASQLVDRLQTFRDQPAAAPSPREISRMTAERAASRTHTGSPMQPVIRRSRVEEIGQRSAPLSAPMDEAPLVAPKPAAPRETVQRKPVEKPAPEPQAPRSTPELAPRPSAVQPKPSATQPVKPSPRAPSQTTVQRKPESPIQDEGGPEGESRLGPRPGLPSLSQQLLQRFEAGRDEWNAEASGSDSELPSFLRPASAPEPTKPAPVQRKPDVEASQPPVIEHRESKPARRAAQSKPAPVVQRKPESEAGADLPLQQKPPATQPAQDTPPPTIQRSAEETEDKVDSGSPAVAEPLAPEVAKTVSTSTDLPLAQPPATVQRKLSEDPTPAASQSDAPGVPPLTPATPVIQRAPEVEPAPSESRRPPKLTVESEPTQGEVSVPEAPQSSQPISQSQAEPSNIQRSIADLPLHVPPPQPTSTPASESLQRAEPPVEPSPQTITPPSARQSLPRSAPPSVQRKPDGAPASEPEPPQPELPMDVREPARPPEAPAPAVSIQRKLTPEARQTSLPLASPRSAVSTPASVAPSIQRTPDEGQPLPEAMPLVTVREAKPVPQAATKPMALVQRQAAETATATLDLPRPSLPLARVAPTLSGQIQREISTAETTTTTTTSGSSGEGSTGESKKSTVDLNDLARRIYPILKRMLAIERERR